MKTSALIAVDIQHDFLPGGALGVTDGDQVIQPTLRLADEHDLMVATRDWHPEGHCSFQPQGGIWPDHCVKGTRGAELADEIADRADIIVSKATELDRDAYSGFEGDVLVAKHPDRTRVGEKTTLTKLLHEQNVQSTTVTGLATDYCVKATVLDALGNDFPVRIAAEASRAVEVEEGDGERAFAEMSEAGAEVAR
jgi:nicotinamidase/pyrazinamidase